MWVSPFVVLAALVKGMSDHLAFIPAAPADPRQYFQTRHQMQ